MAKSNAVWGIDIGQCALKALRCKPHEDTNRITADAFDYIEYPQILSQPEADPATLVREALVQFLSRNSVRGDKVVVSVSGQSGLARFIKLPPVESKRIPDIVKYEARQQIPFALEDVVWDYQQMAGGSEEDGFALETEVGLFAMKRDQVYRALKPFEEAGIEVDCVQLTPLAIYNYTVFDQMPDLPAPEHYDPENPPESVVVLSLGTDTTDLVITNGYRVWQRSVPLGGSHFTKALSKELRLTFTKAEHLKRNAMQAEDRAAVFQAMRPVFGDMLTEVQRSIGFFTNIDRGARIGRVLALGNAMKLPGLQKYLSQNLGFSVAEVESYRGLSGTGVVSSPIFKENLLSFAVCYGLALQGLGESTLSTNLLPKEIVTDRLIRDKKPWAVGVAAALLLGCSISFLGHWRAWNSAHEGYFTVAISKAQEVKKEASGFTSGYEASKTTFKEYDQIGQNLVGNVEGRLLWAELLKAIDSSLPHDPQADTLKPIQDREEIHITDIECEHRENVSSWYNEVKHLIAEGEKIDSASSGETKAQAPVSGSPSTSESGGESGAAPTDAGPTGEGWIIQIKGYHYHNKNLDGPEFVRKKFMDKLKRERVLLPGVPTKGKPGEPELVAVKDLGISYPVLTEKSRLNDEELEDPDAPEPDENGPTGIDGNPVRKMIKVKKFDFTLQFCWQQTPPSKRQQVKEEREKEEAKKKAEADAAAAASGNGEAPQAPVDPG